jgi:hypothetical protein
VNVVPEEHNIKIVKMEINDAEFNPVDEQEYELEIEEEPEDEQDQEQNQELEIEEEPEADEDEQDQEPEPEEHDFDQELEIEEEEADEDEQDQEPEEPPAIDKESYRKMNLQQLKSMVVSKGLSKDANKLKKNELIALLEK